MLYKLKLNIVLKVVLPAKAKGGNLSVFKESKSYRPFSYSWAAEAAQRHSIDMMWDVHQIVLQDDIQQYYSKDGLKTATVNHE